MPEIIMEGAHVLHIDEDGNILLNDDGDQHLNQKQLDHQQFMEMFDAIKSDPDGRGRKLAEAFFEDERIYLERMQNTLGPSTIKRPGE